MNNKYRKLMSDTALFAITNFATKLISFFFIPLYTSVLTTTDYGITDLIQTTVNFIYPFLTLSISEATIRFAFEREEKKGNVLSTSLLIICGGTVLLAMFTPFVGLISESLKQYWFFFLGYYFLHNVHYCLAQYTRGCDKLRLFAVQGVVQTVVVIALNILLLVVFRAGVYGYLCSFLVGYIVAILLMLTAGKFWKEAFTVKVDKQLTVEMLKYSIPMIPTQVFWWINNAADKWIITYYIGAAENGIYSVAHKIPTILTTIIAVFNQAWQVSAFNNYKKDDNSEYFSNVYSFFFYMNFMAATVIISFSQLIGGIMFSNDFYRGWIFVPILLVAAVFNGLSGMLASVFTSAKKTTSLFISTGIGALANIILNIVLVRNFGSLGAAYATAISCILVWIVRFAQTGKYVKIKIHPLKQVCSILILVVQAFLVSNQVGPIWVIGIVSFVALLLINISNLKTVLSIFSWLFKKLKKGKK